MLKIKTNNVPRPLKCLADLPEKAAKDFDYIKDEDAFQARFVQYRGAWYDAYDTQYIVATETHDRPMGWAMHVSLSDPLADWDAIINDTFFSGILFRFVGEDEVVCATYYVEG